MPRKLKSRKKRNERDSLISKQLNKKLNERDWLISRQLKIKPIERSKLSKRNKNAKMSLKQMESFWMMRTSKFERKSLKVTKS